MFRVVLNCVSKVIHVCFGFLLLRVVISLRKSYHFLDQQIKTETNRESLTHFALASVFVLVFECFTGLSASL